MAEDLLVVLGEDGVRRVAMITGETPRTVIGHGEVEDEVLEVPPAASHRVAEGTVEYRAIRDRDAIRAELRDSSGAVRLLHELLWESQRSMSWNELVVEFTRASGLSELELKSLLKGVFPKLQKTPGITTEERAWDASMLPIVDVRRPKKQQPTSVLVVQAVEPPASGDPVAGDRELHLGGQSSDAEKAPSTAPSTRARGKAKAADLLPESPQQRARLLFDHDVDPALLRRLGLNLLKPDDVRLIGAVVDEVERTSALASLSSLGELAGASFALAGSPEELAVIVNNWPNSEASNKHLLNSLTWILSTEEPTARRIVLEGLASVASSQQPRVAAAVLTVLATDLDPRPGELLQLLSKLSPESLKRGSTKADWPTVLRVLNREPLELRWPLLALAFRARAENVRTTSAWGIVHSVAQLGLDQAGRAEVLGDSWVAENIALPAIESELRSTSDLAVIAGALRGPSEVVRRLEPGRLAEALRKAAARHAVLSAAVDKLAEVEQVATMRKQVLLHDQTVADLKATVEAAQARVEDLERALAAETQRRAESEERLRIAGSDQLAASGAALRQSRVEGLRAAVEVLSAMQLGATDDASHATIIRTAERFGIFAIGSRGEAVLLDRALHELLGADNAELVEVRELGWRLEDAEGSHVLKKAAVVAVRD